MQSTYLKKKDIVEFLRNEIVEMYFDDHAISWKEAKKIPIDFAKFYSYPAEGTYDVELLLKIEKVTSKYEAIFCYFVDLHNENNIFSLPFFKIWRRDIPKDAVLSYDERRCYIPLISENTTITNIHLGTNLEINLVKSNKSQYLELISCKLK